MKKIGLLGGTFDPIHNGHLIISEFLRDDLKLDEIWFIPVGIHPLKDNVGISKAGERLKMLELAVADNPYFKTCKIELSREGVSYTVDTLHLLEQTYRNISPWFYYFIGMDNVNELPRWKEPLEILKICQLVAFGRPGFKPADSVKEFIPHIRFVNVPLLEISSTIIRRRVREGRSIKYLVPDDVSAYIEEQDLYRQTGK